ncbi:MAG: heme exporter protein CcmD [Pseudomonadota bacterium]
MMEWLAMNGYGGYVWAAYGASALGIGSIFLLRRREYKRALDKAKRSPNIREEVDANS